MALLYSSILMITHGIFNVLSIVLGNDVLSFVDWCVCLVLKAFINIECVSVMCFNITDGRSLAVVRSNCRGWKWSSVRWLRIKRSSSGTCWN